MNRCLYNLFQNPEKRNRFASGLPSAFEMVRQRMPKRNPAVGILREHVLIGFFEAEFGKDKVIVPEYGIERGYDVKLCGKKLSIKTMTGTGGFKILWTVDAASVKREIDEWYNPECDIFLVNIHWNKKKKSVFYIPLQVQKNIIEEMGRENYLWSATGTNNRGIEIRRTAVTRLQGYKVIRTH